MDSSQDFNGSLFCVVSDLENPNLDFFFGSAIEFTQSVQKCNAKI